MERTPEPELMDDAAQALAYARADFEDSNRSFTAHFETLAGPGFAGHVLDLGCGPGDIPLRLARAHPRAVVHGLDGAAAMVALAREALAREPALGHRVAFVQGLVPDADLPRDRYDAVVSNSLLHHLPDPAALWRTVRRRALPGAPVVVMDLFRPATPAAAAAVVAAYAEGAPAVLRHDFLASLHAAFEPDEIRAQLATAGLRGFDVRVASDRHVLVTGHAPGQAGPR